MATDRLSLARAFEDAGIERSKAENVAEVVLDAIHDNVATKADLALAVTELKLRIAEVKHTLTILGLGALIAGISILFAALQYWPPGHWRG